MKRSKVIYTGNFVDFALGTILYGIIGILTLGLGFFYLSYWWIKYFVTHLEIEEIGIDSSK